MPGNYLVEEYAIINVVSNSQSDSFLADKCYVRIHIVAMRLVEVPLPARGTAVDTADTRGKTTEQAQVFFCFLLPDKQIQPTLDGNVMFVVRGRPLHSLRKGVVSHDTVV